VSTETTSRLAGLVEAPGANAKLRVPALMGLLGGEGGRGRA
jgi:hypothetical protein